jgi:hypothetical protein
MGNACEAGLIMVISMDSENKNINTQSDRLLYGGSGY